MRSQDDFFRLCVYMAAGRSKLRELVMTEVCQDRLAQHSRSSSDMILTSFGKLQAAVEVSFDARGSRTPSGLACTTTNRWNP